MRVPQGSAPFWKALGIGAMMMMMMMVLVVLCAEQARAPAPTTAYEATDRPRRSATGAEPAAARGLAGTRRASRLAQIHVPKTGGGTAISYLGGAHGVGRARFQLVKSGTGRGSQHQVVSQDKVRE